MGIREFLLKHSAIVNGCAIALLLVAGGYIFWSGGLESNRAIVRNTFYSDDDGATYYAGNGSDVVANQRRAKPAYRAAVFESEGGGGRFVGYLTRFQSQSLDAIDAAQAKVEQAKQKASSVNDPEVQKAIEASGAAQQAAVAQSQVKRPGNKSEWILADSAAGLEIMTKITPPSGKAGVINTVLP